MVTHVHLNDATARPRPGGLNRGVTCDPLAIVTDGLEHVGDLTLTTVGASQVESVLEGRGLTTFREPGRERPVGLDEVLVDGELNGLRLPDGVHPGGLALEAETEGAGNLSAVLVDEDTAGQKNVATAPGDQGPGEGVEGEPAIGIEEADPPSPSSLHPEAPGAFLSIVVRLDGLDVKVGSPRPAPADPR